jgi:hypothetical protein
MNEHHCRQLAQSYPIPIYSTSYTPRDYARERENNRVHRTGTEDLMRLSLMAWTWPIAAIAWPILWSAGR